MKYHVSSVTAQGSGSINEDLLLMEENLFAVFDGAGSLVSYRDKQGRTGGALASSIAASAFQAEKLSLHALGRKANRSIEEAMIEAGIDRGAVENRWSTTASAVRIFDDEAEWLNVGDSAILSVSTDHQCHLLSPWVDHDLPTLSLWKQLAEQGERDLFNKTEHINIEVRRQTNITHGALNGMEEAESFFFSGTTSLANTAMLVLFTDGMLIPKPDPAAPEDWAQFTSLIRQRGLNGLLAYVRQLEDTDPQCRQYPRFKCHDDASAIAIQFDAA